MKRLAMIVCLPVSMLLSSPQTLSPPELPFPHKEPAPESPALAILALPQARTPYTAVAIPETIVRTERAVTYLKTILCREEYEWNCDEALRVILCESGGDPSASNNGNYGLFQINAAHTDKLESVTGSRDLSLLLDPELNTEIAHAVWRDSGGKTWTPWAKDCRPTTTP